MNTEAPSKVCFVIAPIGADDSLTRSRSDEIRDFIIRPVTESLNLKVIRADEISEPGDIPLQVIDYLVNADIVIADLTEHNPNVFYELAIRHVVRKPFIHIIEADQDVPFDVKSWRVIKLNRKKINGVDLCRQELREQIEYIFRHKGEFPSPLSGSIDIVFSKGSPDPIEKNLAKLTEAFSTIITDQINQVTDEIEGFRSDFNDLSESADSIKEGVEVLADSVDVVWNKDIALQRGYVILEYDVIPSLKYFQGQEIPGNLVNTRGAFKLPHFSNTNDVKIIGSTPIIQLLANRSSIWKIGCLGSLTSLFNNQFSRKRTYPSSYLRREVDHRHKMVSRGYNFLVNRLMNTMQLPLFGEHSFSWLIVYDTVSDELREIASRNNVIISGFEEWKEIKRIIGLRPESFTGSS